MADPYTIRYSPQAAVDVRAIKVFDRKQILAAVEQHLSHEPTKESRSRIKRMLQPFWTQ